METISTRRADNFHVHLRSWRPDDPDYLMPLVLPFTAKVFGRAIAMPNLRKNNGITTAPQMIEYKEAIIIECTKQGWINFEPLMPIKITPETTPDRIKKAKSIEAIGGKLYPNGVTTNSEGGVTDFKALYPTFDAMEKCELPLLTHSELPGILDLYAEQAFIPILDMIVKNFPKLKIVVEHLSSKAMVDYVLQAPQNVAATITPQHLILTCRDIGNPHNFCKPPAKTFADLEAIIKAATSGNPKFFFGSDSAPHWRHLKESVKDLAGVFSDPVALPVIFKVFEEQNALDKLENFTSVFGAQFYGLPLNQAQTILKKEKWVVPASYVADNGYEVVPFLAGQELEWQVVTD